MNIESYKNGFPYEAYICRAFQMRRSLRNGADSSFMTNLIDAEKGVKNYGLPSAQKQFETVKKYLVKATDKYLKRKLTEEEIMGLTTCKQQFENAYSSGDLLNVINKALELTQRFKEYTFR